MHFKNHSRFPRVLRHLRDQNLYLTFDDGPDPEVTPALLRLLHEYNARASFFLIGQKAEQYPEIVLRIQQQGHTVGNHSFTHTTLFGKPVETIAHEIRRTDNILAEITGQKPDLFRPPHGWFGRNLLRVLKSTGHQLVLWNVSARDYQGACTAAKIHRRLQKLRPKGQIVLLHDGHRNSTHTLQALETYLRQQLNANTQFATLPKVSLS
ncbi:MAG: polysaccharide deacetylase family protein [bacterium]